MWTAGIQSVPHSREHLTSSSWERQMCALGGNRPEALLRVGSASGSGYDDTCLTKTGCGERS